MEPEALIKHRYKREFLLKLFEFATEKPKGLPIIPNIIHDHIIVNNDRMFIRS